MTRRGLLAGLGTTLLAACARGGHAPTPRLAPGTTRLKETYGTGPLQRGEWWIPPGPGRLPTVVLVHGGYWGPSYDRTLEDAVAADLSGRGYLCWNIDYSAADKPWPATLIDVAAGYDHIRAFDRVDPDRIAVVGHSAGGQLALWLASRNQLPAGAPGASSTAPRPVLAVAQAPIASLARASREGLGRGAVDALMGGTPAQEPARFAVADPIALLPTGVPTVLIHGTTDVTVPLSQSQDYVAAATRAGDRSTLETFSGGHFEHLDPGSKAGDLLRRALEILS